MRKVTAAGKFGRLFMTAVMTCTLCVPTQALAAQDASGGASASSASEGENASPASSASEGGSAAVAASGAENVSLAASEGDSSTGTSGNIVDWTEDGTCQWMIDADGNLTVEPTNGVKGTLAYASPWSDYKDKIKTATFKPGVVATTASDMFKNCANMTSVDLSGLDTSEVSAMDDMFCGCSSLESLDLSQLDASRVNNMASMFRDCSSLVTLDLSSLDTSSATDMYALFYGCTSLTSINLSGLDASAVWDMQIMFKGCTSLASLDLSGFKTSGAQTMRDMFSGCSSLTSLDLSSFSTSNVTAMNGMFKDCTKLETISGLSRFDTAKVNAMGYMFSGCSSLKSVDVTSFDTSTVNDMTYAFYGCSSLTSLDLSSFNTSKATGMTKMFDGCGALRTVKLGDKFSFAGATSENMCSLPTPSGDDLTGNWVSSVDGTVYAPASVPSNVAATYTAESNDIATWTVSGGCMWKIDVDGNLTVKPTDGVKGSLADASPWSSYASSVKTATFEPGVVASASTAGMFKNCENMTSVDLSGLDTSGVADMTYMFRSCKALTSIDVSCLDFSSVTDATMIFAYCSSLASINLSGVSAPKLQNVTDMFWFCSALTSVDLSFLKGSPLTNINSMFGYCSALTSLDLTPLDTSAVWDMHYLFYGCSGLTSIDLSSFKTSSLTSMREMFYGCSALTSVNLSGFNTSKADSLRGLFNGCSSLATVDVSGFDTSNVTDMREMFQHCLALTSVDVSGFKTSEVTDMRFMFSGCMSLASLDLSGFDTAKVEQMDSMFDSCGALRTVKLGDKFSFAGATSENMCSLPTPSGDDLTGNWVSSVDGTVYAPASVPSNVAATYTAEVTPIANWTENGGCMWMIDAAGNLTVKPTDGAKGTLADACPWSGYASSIKTATFKPGVVASSSTAGMFKNCENMTSVDLSGLDTSAVTDMQSMFSSCRSLVSLDLSSINIGAVTNMSDMFSGCSSLADINLSGVSATQMQDASRMFSYCTSLESVNLSFLKGAPLTEVRMMFDNCSALKSADLSMLNTSAVDDMNGLFYNCTALESVNLTDFDTSGASNVSGLFHGCSSLKSLDLSDFITSKVTNARNMFHGCSSLTSLNVFSFDTSSVQNMSGMFQDCTSLVKIDGLSSFRTSKVDSMDYMFAGCASLASLDLSSFDTSGASNMNLMFNYCLALRTVTLGEKFAFEGGVAYRQCNLPTPVGNRITGKWVSNLTGVVYDAEDVPTKTAAVYTAEKTAVPFPVAAEGLTYTGEDQTGVAVDEYGCYKLYGDVTATDAGTYSVTAVLEDGYKWEDQTTAPREITWTISRAEVAIPAAAKGLAYTGAAQTGLTAGAGYSLSGTVVATDAGSYEAVAVLDGNHAWTGGSTDAKSIVWSIAKAVVTAPVAKVGLTYTGAEQTGVAAGEGYSLLGSTATNAGSHTAFAVLDGNHIWNDGSTDAKAIAWTIGKAKVASPVAKVGLTYTGAEQIGVAVDSLGLYTIEGGAQTAAGDYTATAKLIDPENHAWTDGTTADKQINWSIAKAVVAAPAAVAGLTYTGAEQTGVAAGEGYSLFGMPAATDAGTYTALAVLDSNHIWNDGLATPKTIIWNMGKAKVTVPVANTGLTYTGAEQAGVSAGEGYVLSGAVTATDAGSYTAIATPDGNHTWADGTADARAIGWSIAKGVPSYEVPAGLTASYGQTLANVALPEGFSWQDDASTSVGVAGEHAFLATYTPTDTANYEPVRDIAITVTVDPAKVAAPTAVTGLVYNGKAQTGVAADSMGLYTVEGGSQTAAGDYTATAKLIDPENHTWADGTTADKQINWSIAKAVTEEPAAKAGLAYTGAEQVGVAAGDGYVLSGAATATDAGSYTAIATPDGNHTWADGTADAKAISWSIAKAAVTAPVAATGLTYTGKEQTAVAAGDGYSLYGSTAATGAGTYTALAVLDGNHIWSDGSAAPKTLSWVIGKAVVEAPAANKGLKYTGAEQTGVSAGEGYVLSGAAAATDAGSYTAIAAPDGNHTWSDGTADAKAIAWSIAKADISTGKAEVEAASFVYMGRAIKPAVTVTVGGKTLTPGVDYMVTYSDNDAIGTAKATVTGMDNYDGALTADFAIVSKVVDVFSDANYGDWYVDFGVLDYAYAHGLVSGYSGTDLVGAYDFITRQDVAVILWRMAGEPEVAGGVDFADVDYGDYYGPAVRWARAAGVINGYQDADGAYRNFGPSDLVTREQLAVMIANYAGKVGGLTVESDCFNLNALPDAASVSDWARTSFGWCVDMGIIGGVQDTVSGVSYAQPGNNAWRISMVSMMAVLHRDVLKLG